MQCQQQHNSCTKCSCFVNAGKTVLEQHIVPLPYLWNKCFGKKYDCEKAQCKLLQMPLVSINVNGKVFIIEKELGSTNYESKRNLISSSICDNGSNRKKPDYMSKKDYEQLINIAETESESEKQILKHVLCSSYNLSKREASKRYGISGLSRRAEKVNDAVESAKDIKHKHMHAMKQEQHEYLLSHGIDPNKFLHEELTSESDNTSDSKSDSSSDSESTFSDSGSESETQFTDTRIKENERMPDMCEVPDVRSRHDSDNSSSEHKQLTRANIEIN